MLKKLFGGVLTDLGTLEGDYRFAGLKSDVSQSILYMFVLGAGILAMLRVDALLFKDRPDLFKWMIIYRVGYAAVTAVFGVLVYRTTKVRIYDRLVTAWLLSTVLFILLIHFTRPANHIATSFSILVPFIIYVLSPLKIRHTFALALIFSIGTLYIGWFHNPGSDPVLLNVSIFGQVTAHLLGWISSIQIQTYRRKSFQALIDERDAKEMVAYLANIDPLTKSLTRRQLLSIAESEFQRFKRYRRSLSMLILDADNFKQINDTYGHHAGDIVLRSLSLVAMEHKRAQDTFGRLGGEEFGLLMPETSIENACVVAERVRMMWELSPVNLDGKLIRSTISIGVAEAVSTDQSLEDLLRRADRMLYKAKGSGRNQIVSE